MTEVADEPKTTTAFLVPVKVAVVILAVILVAFVVGGWRLSAIQHDYTRQIASSAQESAKDYTNKIAASALRTSCENGNDFRKLDKARWDKLLSLFGPPQSAESKRIIDQFVQYIRLADAQRDCSKVLGQ